MKISTLLEDTIKIMIKVDKPVYANILSGFRALRCSKPDENGVSILQGPAEDIEKAKNEFGHLFTVVSKQ